MKEFAPYCRLTPVVSALFLSFFITSVAVYVSLFYYRTYQIIIGCTRLYTFEKKRENDKKDKSLETDYPCSLREQIIPFQNRPLISKGR